MPPSTGMSAPLMKSLSGSDRKMHRRAISCGVPTRWDGCWRWSVSDNSSGSPVWIQPGEMQFTVILYGDNDIIREWVRDAIPPFEAE